MAYKWRATFSFDYPLLDLPLDIGDIRLYPTPPELDLVPHAIHCYEFETSAVDRNAQQEAERMYLKNVFGASGKTGRAKCPVPVLH